MNKLLSIMLFATCFNSIYSNDKPFTFDLDTKYFFLQNGDDFLICKETKDKDEECAPFELAKKLKILAQLKKNEEEAEQLMKKVWETALEFQYENIQMMKSLKKQEKKSTPEERSSGELAFKAVYPEEGVSSMPQVLYKRLSPEELRSMLSEEHQKMLDVLDPKN